MPTTRSKSSSQPKIDQVLQSDQPDVQKGKKRTSKQSISDQPKAETKEDVSEVEIIDHVDKKRKPNSSSHSSSPPSKPKSDPDDSSSPPHDATTKPQITSAEKDITSHSSVSEYGRIHFLYKPRVETPHPTSITDVQRLHIILQPHDRSHPETFETGTGTEDQVKEKKPVLNRLIGVGRKVLPDLDKKNEGTPAAPASTGGRGRGNNAGRGGRQPFWGFVSDVSENIEDLHSRLEETQNETKTKGTRTTGSDRLIASGPYCIISHSHNPKTDSGSSPSQQDTLLVYTLTLPTEMGEVQKAFNLKKEGAFRISVKNPQAKRSGTGAGFGGPGTGLKDKAQFPEELQSRMGQLQWHPLDPPTYLDYQHAELIFIATHPSDLPEIAGEEVMHDMEEIADEGDVELLSKQDGEHATEEVKEEIFAMLRAREGEGKGKIGADSVITGEWE